jgi:hypothetical protein
MQIHLTIRVRCTYVAQSARSSQDPEDTEAYGTLGAWHGRSASRRPRSGLRRAARVHAHPGGRGARNEPLDVHPPCPALRRDDRDRLGDEPRPGRRGRALRRGAEATCASNAWTAREIRSQDRSSQRGDRPRSSGALRREEPRPDRTRVERRRRTDIAGRSAVVAFDHSGGACHSASLDQSVRTARKRGRLIS